MKPPPRLKSLKPRLSMLSATSVSALVAPRLRGRRAVERNRMFLAEHPVCELCPALATEVDHRIPLHLGGIDAEPNLQGLCRRCHAAKTGAEARARAGR